MSERLRSIAAAAVMALTACQCSANSATEKDAGDDARVCSWPLDDVSELSQWDKEILFDVRIRDSKTDPNYKIGTVALFADDEGISVFSQYRSFIRTDLEGTILKRVNHDGFGIGSPVFETDEGYGAIVVDDVGSKFCIVSREGEVVNREDCVLATTMVSVKPNFYFLSRDLPRQIRKLGKLDALGKFESERDLLPLNGGAGFLKSIGDKLVYLETGKGEEVCAFSSVSIFSPDAPLPEPTPILLNGYFGITGQSRMAASPDRLFLNDSVECRFEREGECINPRNGPFVSANVMLTAGGEVITRAYDETMGLNHTWDGENFAGISFSDSTFHLKIVSPEGKWIGRADWVGFAPAEVRGAFGIDAIGPGDYAISYTLFSGRHDRLMRVKVQPPGE